MVHVYIRCLMHIYLYSVLKVLPTVLDVLKQLITGSVGENAQANYSI